MKYEDQRSTSLAVDNLGGAIILGRVIRVDHTRYKPKEGEAVDENTHQNPGDKLKDGDDRDGHRKRRRGPAGDSGDDDGPRKRTPPREMLKEELELQKLIRDHDEEDPMKEYLIRQKKEDVEKALGELKREKVLSNHRHDRGGDRSERRHRSHKHRSRSKELSRRHRSRSKDHRSSTKSREEIDHTRDKDGEAHRKRTDDRERIGDKDMRREMGHDREKGAGIQQI